MADFLDSVFDNTVFSHCIIDVILGLGAKKEKKIIKRNLSIRLHYTISSILFLRFLPPSLSFYLSSPFIFSTGKILLRMT